MSIVFDDQRHGELLFYKLRFPRFTRLLAARAGDPVTNLATRQFHMIAAREVLAVQRGDKTLDEALGDLEPEYPSYLSGDLGRLRQALRLDIAAGIPPELEAEIRVHVTEFRPTVAEPFCEFHWGVVKRLYDSEKLRGAE